jgi:hypothetical protein
VLFSAAWMGEPPPDEPNMVKMTLDSAMPQAGTGRGARVEQRFQEVRRQTGVPRAVITLRYDKPAAEPTPTPTPTPVVNEVVINAPAVQIMSGSTAIGTAVQGEQLAVNQTQGDWLLVTRPAALLTERGWVHRSEVETFAATDVEAPSSLSITAAKARVMSGPTVVATASGPRGGGSGAGPSPRRARREDRRGSPGRR